MKRPPVRIRVASHMSNSQQSNKSNSTNYQYASTTPSVSSILNLPQVQDKKKTVGVSGLATGLAGKPVGVSKPVGTLGLAPSKQPQSLGVLKLKKPETPVEIKVEDKSSVAVENKPCNIVENKSQVTAQIKAETKPNTLLTTSAKVVKPKAENHKTIKNKNTQTTAQSTKQTASANVNPNDHFNPSHWRLFVGNLGPEVSDTLLLNTFQNPYPSTSKVLIVRDWKTQKSKGYAFVAFADGKEFLRALKEMNGKWIGNRQCIIKKIFFLISCACAPIKEDSCNDSQSTGNSIKPPSILNPADLDNQISSMPFVSLLEPLHLQPRNIPGMPTNEEIKRRFTEIKKKRAAEDQLEGPASHRTGPYFAHIYLIERGLIPKDSSNYGTFGNNFYGNLEKDEPLPSSRNELKDVKSQDFEDFF